MRMTDPEEYRGCMTINHFASESMHNEFHTGNEENLGLGSREGFTKARFLKRISEVYLLG
jgi:hypothetical protein